jgi:hypothetical protein
LALSLSENIKPHFFYNFFIPLGPSHLQAGPIMASSNPPPVQRWVRFITGLDNELNPNNELIVEICTNHEDEDLYQKLISVMRLYRYVYCT